MKVPKKILYCILFRKITHNPNKPKIPEKIVMVLGEINKKYLYICEEIAEGTLSQIDPLKGAIKYRSEIFF